MTDTAGHTTIARVDRSLERVRRLDIVSTVCIGLSVALIVAALVVLVHGLWPPRHSPSADRVGAAAD